jgi:hypothetical protein
MSKIKMIRPNYFPNSYVLEYTLNLQPNLGCGEDINIVQY